MYISQWQWEASVHKNKQTIRGRAEGAVNTLDLQFFFRMPAAHKATPLTAPDVFIYGAHLLPEIYPEEDDEE